MIEFEGFRSSLKNIVVVAATVLNLLASVQAHDYWFEADNFFPAPGSPVSVRMNVGTALMIEEERPYQVKRTVLFKLFSARDVTDLFPTANDGAIPAVKFLAERPGTLLLAMERNAATNVMAADKFHEYLAEEGLMNVIKERERRGEAGKFGYERYTRYMKSLISVGGKNDSTFKKAVGLKLEIIPFENPYSKKPGDKLKVKIMFRGRPLTDASVFAYNRNAGHISTQGVRTAGDGTAYVKIDRSGFWLIRLVKMERCTEDCSEIDWESYWGALSFEIR